MRIAIAGAGSIGCFTGALLAEAGHDVVLLGRERILEEIREHGVTVTDFSGLRKTVAADTFTLSDQPDCLREADVVIVTVKSPATASIAHAIAQHAPSEAVVISWQNGMENVVALRSALPNRFVRAGMVPFNVVPIGPAFWHRASSGDIVIEAGPKDLGRGLTCSGLTVKESDRIEAVQWGKLVVNLNNALNALSGLTLQEQLMDRDWRSLMADQMAEALGVLRASAIAVKSTTPLPARLVPFVLRLPTGLFRRIAARMLTIDPKARTSMAYDLLESRPTEIDSLQGEIIALGQLCGRPTPLCQRITELIEAEPGGILPSFTPAEIRSAKAR